MSLIKSNILKNIIYFFPFQLVVTYFKRNQFLILLWIIIFAAINGSIGNSLGIPTLFLVPEYIEKVGFSAYFLYGITFGSFIIAFNISSYIVNGYRFPFITTLEHPFFKFSVNNFIIPTVFVIFFIVKSYSAQKNQELLNNWQIVLNFIGFLTGLILFLFFAFLYFLKTNKNINKYFGVDKEVLKSKRIIKPLSKILEKDKKWKQQMFPKNNLSGAWRVETYLTPKLKIKKARDFSHYSYELISKVLHQNHYNTIVFRIFILAIVLFLIFFNDLYYFNFPASVSFLLFLNILLMLYSLFHLFFKEWSVFITTVILLIFLYYPKNNFLNYNNTAYGLKYYKKIIELKSYKADLESNISNDINSTIEILNKWKAQNIDSTGKLPKIIFVNTSGGGLKASLWTYKLLTYIDSVTNDEFNNQIFLITGASGGMLGAAFYRELEYQKLFKNNLDFDITANYNNLSKDILNPVMFSFFLKDWLFKFQKFKYKGNKYYIDRARMFDSKFNFNTNNILNKTLYYYKKPEKNAEMPMIILAPTIVNYGRKLYISPQGVSYLVDKNDKFSNIDFRKFYKYFNPDSLSFISALRMNATFPYVMPIVNMPGSPKLNIMDAGVSDNYGLTTTLKFINTFSDWINANTSGIILIQITEYSNQKASSRSTTFDEFILPFSTTYNNLFDNQELNNQTLIGLTRKYINKNIDFVYFNLNEKNTPLPLSWHLTKNEKQFIFNFVNKDEFKNKVDNFVKSLKN